MCRNMKFGQYRSNRGEDMVIFRFCKIAAAAIFDFSHLKFLTVRRLKRAELRRHAKVCQNWSNRGRDMAIFRFFQDGGRPPSWICYVCVRTTHEAHFVVFIAVQNLVEMDAVVLIICMFFAYSRPQNLGFGRFDLLNEEAHQLDPKRHILWQKDVI